MSLQGKQVLIIDDSVEVRLVVRRILENLGMTVTECASVDEALRILETKIPHLIILDIGMEGKTGFDFLTLRSQMPTLISVPVIVASGRSDPESVHKAMSLGANNYILKPISSAILSQRVRKHARSLDYMEFQFTTEMPDVSLQVKAQITSIGDTNFLLGSSVRLAKSCIVKLVPPAIGKVNLASYVLMSGPERGGRSFSGRYQSKINVVGLKESIPKQLKKGE